MFVISIQARNFLVGHGGDIYIRMVLFWGLFLPLGSRFSVDAALKQAKKGKSKPKSYKKKDPMVLNGGTVALLFQICILYVFSWMHKTSLEWNVHNTASYYALSLDYFRTRIGDFFLMVPGMLKWFNWAVLNWEGYGAVFFFIPWKNKYFKAFGVLGFVAASGISIGP